MDIFQFSHLALFILGFVATSAKTIEEWGKEAEMKIWKLLVWGLGAILFVVFGIIAVMDDINSPKESQDHIEKTVVESKESVISNSDSNTKEVKDKLDSLTRKDENNENKNNKGGTFTTPVIRELPFLDILTFPGERNPYIDTFITTDQLGFRVYVVNTGKATAYSIHAELTLIADVGGSLGWSKLPNGAGNETTSLSPNINVKRWFTFPLNYSSALYGFKTQIYAYVKVSYSYSANSRPSETLRKLYTITPFELKRELHETLSPDFDRIQRYLSLNKAW